MLWLTRSPEILSEPDAADAIYGLKIGAAVLGVPALILLVAAIGLWRSKRWGWWLTLATDVAILATLVYSMLDENTVEWDEAALTVCFVFFPVLLLLPKVRKFYWGNSTQRVEFNAAEPKP